MVGGSSTGKITLTGMGKYRSVPDNNKIQVHNYKDRLCFGMSTMVIGQYPAGYYPPIPINLE